MTTKSEKQCSSAQKRIHGVSELKQWMTWDAAVIDEAHTSEWHKRLQTCVYTRDGRFQ